MKNEPQWMRDFRLRSLRTFEKRPMPNWGGNLSDLNFQQMFYYITLLVTPMFTFSGIFFPPTKMPHSVQVAIWFTPLYHVAHLTWGWAVAPPRYVENDPYANVVAGFQVWWVSAIYIVANLALGLHLYHGLWSMFNSVGLNHVKFNSWKRVFATAFAVIVTVANVSFPAMVLAGVIA